MSRSLNVVHLLPALIKGGAERVVVDLANASFRNGHAVTVVACSKVDEQILRTRLETEVRVLYIAEAAHSRLQRYVVSLWWVLRQRSWLLSQDILHLHLTQAAVLGSVVYVLRNWRGGNRPAIVETYHAVGMKIPTWLRTFHVWNCRHRDAVAMMAMDPFWRTFIADNPRILVKFIPNGVDAPIGAAPQTSVRAYLDQIGIPSAVGRIVGTVGQFRSERQPQVVARILMNVLKRAPHDVCALMCGSGPELDGVRSLIKAEGLTDRFFLPGVANEPRLPISSMSVYLTINVGSITGIAALEAAFCQVPVVALQFDASSDRDDEEWIWSSVSCDMLTERIEELLEDSNARAQMSSAQHQHAIREFSVDRMYEKYIELYYQALGKRGLFF